jgi:hypothetical protein
LSFDLHGFGDEVDADGGLGRGRDTLEVDSKVSWMKREIMEVLPTFWSPRKTALNLLTLDMAGYLIFKIIESVFGIWCGYCEHKIITVLFD